MIADIDALERIQRRAAAGEPRGHLVALVEFGWDMPIEQAERLVPRIVRADSERADCEKPIRDEDGKFLGCEAGEGGEEAPLHSRGPKRAEGVAKKKEANASAPAGATLEMPPLPEKRRWNISPEYEAEQAEEALEKSYDRWKVREEIGHGLNDYGFEERSKEASPGLTYSGEEFSSIRDTFTEGLTDGEFAAGLFYSHQGDGLINYALRRGEIDDDAHWKAKIYSKHLDTAIEKHTMEKDTYVARGMAGEFADKFAASLSEGDVFQENGYTSTSATRPLKTIKTPDGGEVPVSVSVRIKVPKGSKAAPIPSRYPEEDEYLLPRGSKFRVSKVTRNGAKTELELEVVQ